MNARAASANDWIMANVCTIISSLRLSLRSATSPAHAPRQQHRKELAGGQEPDGDAAVGEPQHQQGLGDECQPVADLGDQLATEEQPKVSHVHRAGMSRPKRSRSAASLCVLRHFDNLFEHVERGFESLAFVVSQAV